MPTYNQTRVELLVTVTCYRCGIQFGLPENFYDYRQRDRENFYCPNGHGQHFIDKTEAQKERERREQAEVRARALRDQLSASERSNRALKGVVTKTKKRIGNGVCPCCRRHFTNVERHMSTQHPDYAESASTR